MPRQLNKFILLSLILSFYAPTALAAGALAISPPPFTVQAPLAEWSDSRQQDGCEEASALMAIWAVRGKTALSKAEAKKQLLAISDFEKKKYGEYRDVSLADMKAWIFKDYFKYDQIEIKEKVTLDDLKAEVKAGHLILAPMNGRALKNPHFKAPGPERHMVLIYAYDAKKKEFITNDPGTRYGAGYRYPEKVLYQAIRAYSTGYHKPIKQVEKSVLVVTGRSVKK